MKLRIAMLAATVIAAPLAAHAQVVDGPYISGAAGTTYEAPETAKHSVAARFNWGWAGKVAAGYGYGNGFRAELQGVYLNNQMNHVTGEMYSAGGHEQKYGGFANVLYDFDLGSTVYYPYAGVGVGYEAIRENLKSDGYELSGTKGSVAAQAIIGVAFPISGVPGLSLTADDSFQDAFSDRSYSGVKFKAAYNNSIELGLRYAFNTPTPAPAPVAAPPPPTPAPVATPAPAPARTYLVFFDWDKSDLTDKAKAIIADAAQASTKVQTTQIAVNGYTDLSGTAKYNQKLSVRRAQAVAAELVRLGVARSEIDIKGFGETNPLVPTAPGVREPQNRRVEIILK